MSLVGQGAACIAVTSSQDTSESRLGCSVISRQQIVGKGVCFGSTNVPKGSRKAKVIFLEIRVGLAMLG